MFEVPEDYTIPDLSCLVAGAELGAPRSRVLETIYLDTHDLRLVRFGITLCRRSAGPDARLAIDASSGGGGTRGRAYAGRRTRARWRNTSPSRPGRTSWRLRPGYHSAAGGTASDSPRPPPAARPQREHTRRVRHERGTGHGARRRRVYSAFDVVAGVPDRAHRRRPSTPRCDPQGADDLRRENCPRNVRSRACPRTPPRQCRRRPGPAAAPRRIDEFAMAAHLNGSAVYWHGRMDAVTAWRSSPPTPWSSRHAG